MNKGQFESFRHIVSPRAKGYKLAYFTTAAIAVVFELLLTSDFASYGSYVTVTLMGFGLVLATAPWIGFLGDLLYITVFVLVDLSGHDSSFSFPVFGVFLIATIWIIEHYVIAAVALLAGISLLGVVLSEEPLARTLNDIVLIAIVLGVGFTLRAFSDRETTSVRELMNARQESRSAVASVRGELAAQLHDTIARDLARVAIAAQNLAAKHPELADEIDPLAAIAQDASRRLRPMIMDLHLSVTAPSLRAAVKESASMLRSRAMVLNVDMVADIDQLLSRQTLLTASLFVREAATNVLKYGQASANVELYVDLDDGELALMMSNQIATEPIDHTLTGGFGLANLQSRIESEGGRMSFVSTGAQWMINAAIPNLQNNTEGDDND